MLLYRFLIGRRFVSSEFRNKIEFNTMGFEAMDFVVRHSSSAKTNVTPKNDCSSYEKAINALNNLLPNSSFLQNSVVTQQRGTESLNLADTEKYLVRAGMTIKDLEKLKVIHVSGTKGKGSTCALVESILRSHGLRTGFYSSPHLVSVTERIRLGGLPISKESFAKYFWTVHRKLEAAAQHDTDYPPYFKFLTIMSFYVFLQEKIDVAIIEVGIGGQYDCTNILPLTKTAGITSLGLEHTQILGNTLQEIAWNKAGIIKNGADVFTVQQQENSCVDVIRSRAEENNARMFVVPEWKEYEWVRNPNVNSLNEIRVQQMNASLAIQLALNWMHHNVEKSEEKYKIVKNIPEKVTRGIERCFWPGRCQLLQYGNKNFYLDGAHTFESIQVCSNWFSKCTKSSKNKKILIFNMTGPRQTSEMMSLLMETIHFDVVFFVPNVSSLTNATPDIVTSEDQLKKCRENQRIWQNLSQTTPVLTKVLPSIFDVMQFVDTNLSSQKIESLAEQEYDILVTGSLHLIGACLMGLEEYDKSFRNT